MWEYVGRGLTHKQGILESGKLRGRNFGEKLWGSRACMGLAWWEEDGCELWHKAVCGTTTPGSRLLVCRVTLCTTMQVYAKFGLLGAVSFTLCNMYCSLLHNDVCTMHVCSSYMHLHGPLVVPCDVCGGRGDGQGTAPSILVQHLECNQTSADQHFETKHTFDQVQHSTSSKCSMVNPKKLLAEPEEKQTNSGLSQCPQTPFVPRTVWPMWSLISGVDNCILVTIRWSHVYKYVSPLGSAWLGEGARGFQPHPSPSSTSVGRSRSGSSTTFYLHYCYYSRPPVSRGRSGIFLLRPTTFYSNYHYCRPLKLTPLPAPSVNFATIHVVPHHQDSEDEDEDNGDDQQNHIMIWGGDAYHDYNKH